MRDLPALWSSRQWRDEAEDWIRAQVRVTGPIEQTRLRFWSTVLRVPTSDGIVWFKENAPSQSFEAALVLELSRLVPGRVPPVVAADLDRGWLLTADLGPVLGADPQPADRAGVAHAYAVVQRALEPHLRAMFDAGVPAFEDGNAMAYAVALADELARLPEGDGRRVTAEERRRVDAGLRRLGEAAAVLEASGMRDSLEHNDLHLNNAIRRPDGTVAFIDFGDAVWAHPFASIRVLLWQSRIAGSGPGSPEHERILEAYLDPWAGVASPAELWRAVAAAERIGCLHRAESWRRLMSDVPLESVPEEFRDAPRHWLLVATSADPFVAAQQS